MLPVVVDDQGWVRCLGADRAAGELGTREMDGNRPFGAWPKALGMGVHLNLGALIGAMLELCFWSRHPYLTMGAEVEASL